MNSLRVRMLLATVLVAGVAVVVSALLSRQVVTSEFRRFTGAHPVDLGPVTRRLDSAMRLRGTLAGTDAQLARAASATGRALVIVDSSGRIIAASAPLLRHGRVQRDSAGRVRIDLENASGPERRGMQMELLRPPTSEIRDAAGRVAGTVLALPEPQGPGAGSVRFLRGVNRGFWEGALAAILVGAALVWLLSSRILGPIEALATAARRMERGDLAARVTARGGDEVATLARRFNEMAESLGRSFQLRRQLTHDVAHELRTPLTSLRAQIEAIEDGLVEPDADTMASLHREVLLLASLVGDLEQLAQAEAGVLRLELADLSVADALRDAADAFAVQAREHEVAIDLAAPPDLRVRADSVRLAQILRNLLANAITHTPAKGRVTLSAAREGERVAIAVADTGAGIPAGHLPHIFDRFYRADASRTRATGGTGLGLAIVQQLVRAHGGEVRAENEPGRGARFTLHLPAV